MTTYLLTLALVVPPVAADPLPHPTAEFEPTDGAWVGQRVTLAVTLFAPGLFAGPPAIDVPRVSGVVILPPSESPVVGSQQIDGTSYTTQRHEFAVYAQRPGEVVVPPIPVRFETNAGFGTPTVQRTAQTPAVSFPARTPPGAEGLGTVIAARGLRLLDKWDPDVRSLHVGDAVTRTITMSATDVPGMVFPPVRFGPIDGLAAYPKEPVVGDRSDRGELTGRRTDAVTFVCERPGSVTIPDRTLTWFDLDAKKLRTEALPGRTFSVTPVVPDLSAPPLDNPPVPALTESGWWVVALGGTATAVGCLLRSRSRLWVDRLRQQLAQSEATYFAAFRRACRTGNAHAAYVALLAWRDRSVFGHSAPEIVRVVDELGDLVFAKSPTTQHTDLRSIYEAVRRARHRLRHPHNGPSGTSSALPMLNPTTNHVQA